MEYKIIKIEEITDRQVGDCTRVSANPKPNGFKSFLPYSMVANSYDSDTYKFLVPRDSKFVEMAQSAQSNKQYLEIDLTKFRENESVRLDDIVIDTLNLFFSEDFFLSHPKKSIDNKPQKSNQKKSYNEFWMFDIQIDNFHDGYGQLICVMATPVEYRVDENGEKIGYYSKEYQKEITRPFIFPYSDKLYSALCNLKDQLDEEDGLWTLSYSDFVKHTYHAIDGTNDFFVFYYYKDFEDSNSALNSSITAVSPQLAEDYFVFEDMDEYDEYNLYEILEYDDSCFAEKHHYDDKIYDHPLDLSEIISNKADSDDIFADYRQIMFLDNNPFEQPRRYNAKITTTYNGNVNQNHDINIIATGKRDAIETLERELSFIEGRRVTEKDFLSCVIAPI